MLLQEKLKNYQVILASQSPRRRELLSGLLIDFTHISLDIDESYPKNLKGGEITEFIANNKSKAYGDLKSNEILITADTTVWHNNKALEKPKDKEDAIEMIQSISGSSHEVFTSVCIRTNDKFVSFTDQTTVFFKALSEEEIKFYVKQFKPFDKAGAYGIQEWIGYIAIEKMNGNYFNVMGLPVQKLYLALNEMF